MGDVTLILQSIDTGDPRAREELLGLVYAELRRIAAHRMSLQQPGQTLQPTALVHEAWLKLMGSENQSWQTRRHFLNAAAEAMRQILVDVARRKQAVRHGGGLERVPYDGLELALPMETNAFLSLHEALDRLESSHPAKDELVKLKYFMGLENVEAAEALGIPLRSVERQWAFARAWLKREVEDGSAA